MNSMPRLLGILFVLALSRPVLGVSPSWVARWRGDLEFVRRTVPARHANAFHAISRHRFDSMLDALEKNLPSLGQHEIEVRLARIIAAIGDGHTRLSLPLAPGTDLPEGDSKTDAPSDASLLFHGYPLRFGIYADGTYVERIAPRFAKYAGSKLLAIDGHPTQDVIAAITPTIRHDNPSQRLDLLPSRLVLAELLHATGIVRDIDHATFTLETPEGDRVDIVLAPQRGSVVHWADAKPAAARRPLAFRHLEGPSPMTGSFTKNYWLAWLPRSKTIYVQIDRSLDDHAEPLYDFAHPPSPNGRRKAGRTAHRRSSVESRRRQFAQPPARPRHHPGNEGRPARPALRHYRPRDVFRRDDARRGSREPDSRNLRWRTNRLAPESLRRCEEDHPARYAPHHSRCDAPLAVLGSARPSRRDHASDFISSNMGELARGTRSRRRFNRRPGTDTSTTSGDVVRRHVAAVRDDSDPSRDPRGYPGTRGTARRGTARRRSGGLRDLHRRQPDSVPCRERARRTRVQRSVHRRANRGRGRPREPEGKRVSLRLSRRFLGPIAMSRGSRGDGFDSSVFRGGGTPPPLGRPFGQGRWLLESCKRRDSSPVQ